MNKRRDQLYTLKHDKLILENLYAMVNLDRKVIDDIESKMYVEKHS